MAEGATCLAAAGALPSLPDACTLGEVGVAYGPSLTFRVEYIVHLIPQEAELGPMALEMSALFKAAVS